MQGSVGAAAARAISGRRCVVRSETLEEKLERFSIPEPMSGCVLWMGAHNNGYGQIRHRGEKFQAHRAAYEIANGPIDAGLVIDHLCRNPACINPRHLEAVTQRENTLRGIGPAARNANKSFCKRGHPLSGQNLYVGLRGDRQCRRCGASRGHAGLAARQKRLAADVATGGAPAPTRRQLDLLQAIHRLSGERGFPPTNRELCGALGVASTNGVAENLDSLEALGLITRDRHTARSLRLSARGLSLSSSSSSSTSPAQTEVAR